MRDLPPETVVMITDSETLTLTIENIRSVSPTVSLLVQMRQQSSKELSWPSIVQGNPTKIQLAPVDVSPGDYELILESFNQNGSQKLTLK